LPVRLKLEQSFTNKENTNIFLSLKFNKRKVFVQSSNLAEIQQPKALLHNLQACKFFPWSLLYNMMSMQSALRGQMDGYSLTAPATSSFCSCSFAASETSETDSFPNLHHFKYYGIGSG
jgi:hypothetical protein